MGGAGLAKRGMGQGCKTGQSLTRFIACRLQVLKVNATTGNYTVVAGLFGGSDKTGILATSAKLNNPTYVAVEPVNGTMFISEYGESAGGRPPDLLCVGNSL